MSFQRAIPQLLMALLLGAPVVAQTETQTAEEGSTPSQESLQVRSFHVVWDAIESSWWKGEEQLADWQRLKGQYLSRVEDADDAKQVRNILRDLLGELRASHYAIIPRKVHERFAVKIRGDKVETNRGTTGLQLRMLDEDVVVTRVEPSSPAAGAGIKTGWLVDSIDGELVHDILIEMKEALQDSTFRLPSMVGHRLTMLLRGRIGEEIQLDFLDEEGDEQSLRLTAAAPQGKWATLGHLPPQLVQIESKTLDEDVQYFRFSVFFDPLNLLAKFNQSLDKARSSGTLILDLRGNAGGIGGLTMGIGRHLVSREAYLGTMKFSESELRFWLNPAPNPYDGKVAVLIDECSFSSAEILAGGLQAIGRARVFGQQTAGAALPSMIVELPNGDYFQYAICDYISSDGKRIEGTGVQPDVSVQRRQDDLLSGRDKTLEAALEWLHDEGSEESASQE